MKDGTKTVEGLLEAAIRSGEFSDIQEAEDAVRAWLQQRSADGQSIVPSLKGDMTEDGDAEYQEAAMRSVDA